MKYIDLMCQSFLLKYVIMKRMNRCLLNLMNHVNIREKGSIFILTVVLENVSVYDLSL